MPSSYTLGAHFEGLVRDLVESGRYASASEVLRDGLRLLEEREDRHQAKLEALREAVREGVESGAPEPFDFQSFMSELRGGSDKRGA
ncbi:MULTISPECIES: type II toxin-antitoxin system ParD family antitoxin [Phyllobacteriaceae]|uniref:type II toxin-antitoxin system ParD family antitoxin n=1 Tax=Phyllobacteriaceae TaxID=69277 RepID=UPI00309B1905